MLTVLNYLLGLLNYTTVTKPELAFLRNQNLKFETLTTCLDDDRVFFYQQGQINFRDKAISEVHQKSKQYHGWAIGVRLAKDIEALPVNSCLPDTFER